MTFSRKGNIFLIFILTLVLINPSIAQEYPVTLNSSQVPAILQNMSNFESTERAITHRLPLHILEGDIPTDQLNNLSRNMNIAGRLKKPVNLTSADIYDRKADVFNARNKNLTGKALQVGHISRNASVNIDDLPRVSTALTTTPVHNINKGTNYTTIQEAIDNASTGDEIHVDSGTYYENVNVTKQLTLRGIGMPVVNAGGSGSAITLAADGIVLENFTATGGGIYFEAGIMVTSNNNALIGNNASNNGCDYFDYCDGYGILLSHSSNNMLRGNDASYNIRGISLESSSNNTLISNNANSNAGCDYMGYCVLGYGISLWSSRNNTLYGNTANLNNYIGISLSYFSNNNTLIGNNASDYDAYWSSSIGIDIGSSSNNTLISNNASNNNLGISLESSSKNVLINNMMKGNLYNFKLDGISYSDFDNQIDTTNMVDGKPIYYIKGAMDTGYDSYTNAGTFYCISCVNVTLNNLDLKNNYFGIFLWNVTRSNIQNVNASNNYHGIHLWSSDNNILRGSNANGNGDTGIFLGGNNNMLIDNTASNNVYEYFSPWDISSSGSGIILFGNNNTLLGNNALNNGDSYVYDSTSLGIRLVLPATTR